MEWTDQGILLSARNLQENKKIFCFFTRNHGKWNGVSQRQKNLPQPSHFYLNWKARLEENLGHWKTIDLANKGGEPTVWMLHPGKPFAVASILGLFNHLLGDRDPHPCLFDGFLSFMNTLMTSDDSWIISYISLELLLLKELGFSLDLEKCALSQATQNLSLVSPLTGRAVTKEAAGSYAPRLLPLPGFLGKLSALEKISPYQAEQGLELTGYFLNKIYMENLPSGVLSLPTLRDTFKSWVSRLPCLQIETEPFFIHEAPLAS